LPAYTDLNYYFLGEIVRRVAGRDIGYYITRGIIDKLQLRETSYPTGSALPGGLHGYGWNPLKRRFEDKTLFNPVLAGAAGAMISSMQDLHVYVRAVLRRTAHTGDAARDASRSTSF
jgi:D-alanyl-D-alanine carboxypeptidase